MNTTMHGPDKHSLNVSPFIVVDNLTFRYQPNQPPVFEDFSWHIKRGETWAVLGPSGCGKSTLLVLLAGLEFTTAGNCTIDGQSLSAPRPRTGLVLQHYGLLPWATVYDNIALGLRIRGFYGPDGRHAPWEESTSQQDIQERTLRWIARLALEDVADAFPGRISGGQRQRTAIARTLALSPDLLLLDEPFSALDAPTREGLQDLTLDLCRESGITVVLVTHNIEEAAYIGQHILLLDQPPNIDARVLDNAHSNMDNYRASATYREMCNRLRLEMGS